MTPHVTLPPAVSAVVLTCLVVVTVALVWWWRRSVRKTADERRAWAMARGWVPLDEQGPPGVAPVHPFTHATGGRSIGVARGYFDGLPVRVGVYTAMLPESIGAYGGKIEHPWVATECPRVWPQIIIRSRDEIGQPRAAAFPDRFSVQCDDPSFAQRFVSPAVQEVLQRDFAGLMVIVDAGTLLVMTRESMGDLKAGIAPAVEKAVKSAGGQVLRTRGYDDLGTFLDTLARDLTDLVGATDAASWPEGRPRTVRTGPQAA